MKILPLLTLLLLLPCAAVRGESTVGIDERAFVPKRERHWRGAEDHRLLTRIWYPATSSFTIQPRVIGGIFLGQPVSVGVGPSDQARHPLLLLSHGTGGGSDSLDWLAAALAAQGYIVAGVNHPGNTVLAPLTWDGFSLWWERAADLSDVLDAMLADPVFGSRIDPSRIGAIGFSLGGYTVLSLAGARTDRAAFSAFCDSPARDAGCRPPEMKDSGEPAAVSAETARSLAGSGQSFKDARVKAVFALAPALGEAFHDGSFDEVSASVALAAGEQDSIVPLATNARRYASLLPKAELTLIEGAGHYSMLDDCVPDVVEHVPLLCKELPGTDRDALHARVVELARTFFASKL